MNQARGVLALQLAREACFERTGELPAELRSQLTLAAIGESMSVDVVRRRLAMGALGRAILEA